jgi:hypothetical protein
MVTEFNDSNQHGDGPGEIDPGQFRDGLTCHQYAFATPISTKVNKNHSITVLYCAGH